MGRLKSIWEVKDLREKLEREPSRKLPCIVVSNGTCGQARGSAKVVKAFQTKIKRHNLQNKVMIRITGCHGFCEVEPNIIIQPEGIFYQKLKPEDAEEIVGKTVLNDKIIDRLLWQDPESGKKVVYEKDISFFKKQNRLISGNSRFVDPTSIDDYMAIGGYSALCKVISDFSSQEVINEIKNAGLRGRGGAGFPTGIKWELCRKAKGDIKYIICNADEGDPGAYMDRSLLEGNPHSVIEGMIIGAYAIGANEGIVYVRNEYPLAVKNVGIAIEQARKYGFLGEDILGTGFSFDIKIAKGAGAFVCGEETALIASIEGRRGEPRQRPPFPAQKGLWRKPTNINNVESWANVPFIIQKGAKWYSKIGSNGCKGTKIFSLVGKINNTGLVEVPMGMPLWEIIYDIGGGIPGGKKFKAVQTGGPSGGCIPTELLNLPVDYEKLTEVGSIMGSGGMIVMDENTCMVDIAKYFLNFLKDESCGKCLACREGIDRMFEIVTDISEGRGTLEQLDLLEELARVVKDASMCGLGQTASNPVLSTLTYFRDEYLAHIKYKRCEAAVCKEIISSPCQHTCPIDTEAPVYISYIAKKEFTKALEVIRKDNPLPSVCSRVCHHPCESKCQSGEEGEPIAIRSLKRFVSDYGIKNQKAASRKQKRPTIQKKVAIVGSGPAGLTAGYYLAQKGYLVTIFEALPVVGGMLSVAIPEYRLPREILNFDIENIKDSGITIKTNVKIGKDLSINDLFKKGYKAIFIATGAHKSLKLGISDENISDVIPSMKFLTRVNLGKTVKIGKRVGVIGGGNSAVDAARVANRMEGCDRVTIMYRRTRLEMPAFKEEVDAAIEEGIDIHFLSAPVRILTENGKFKGVECIRMKLGDIDKSGRRRPVPIEGSEFTIKLDNLIVAIGEKPDLSFLSKDIEISKWNTIVVDPETLSTNRERIFAGGDVVTGSNTVVDAIASGKLVAESIDKYLRGESLAREYKVTRPSIYIEPGELTEKEIAEAKRPKMPCLKVERRVNNFKEIELGFTQKMTVKEARRCLRCDLETEDGKKAVGRE